MKATVKLIAPPVAIQPGGYVATAYADHARAATQSVQVVASAEAGVWTVDLRWRAPEAVLDASADPRAFVDGAALFAPETRDAPWITMGTPESPLDGVLWRADAPAPLHVRAQGLGSVVRSPAAPDWKVAAAWSDGYWQVRFTLPGFAALNNTRQLGVAVWQGAQGQRAGLKSVSPGWIAIEES
jgi:DMSO reductase family type II enzyme heme b subunit